MKSQLNIDYIGSVLNLIFLCCKQAQNTHSLSYFSIFNFRKSNRNLRLATRLSRKQKLPRVKKWSILIGEGGQGVRSVKPVQGQSVESVTSVKT